MKLNYVRRFSAYVSTFYHSEYITLFNILYRAIDTLLWYFFSPKSLKWNNEIL